MSLNDAAAPGIPPRGVSNLADGEWHRLHPATPLLKGGVALIAITGIVIANLRERLVELFFGVPSYGGDPIDEIYNRGAVGWALLAILGALLIVMVGFYLSWRMHSFRVTEEAVEVRSGILFRTNRKARLDRIQGVNIDRPLLPRIFGAAKLEVGVAGQDANVQLAYLGSSHTDALRRDILRLASGMRQGAAAPAAAATPGTATTAAPAELAPGTVGAANGTAAGHEPHTSGAHGLAASAGALITQRANEFLAPELDPDAAPPESVVHIPPLRLIASIAASGFTLVLIALAVAVPIALANQQYWVIFGFVPALIGGASYYINRFTKGLRYTIAGTADGVRVGYGLLSTSNETIPPGRIHAIAVTQPLLWRPFGWWTIRINTAGHSQQNGQNASNTTVLPVGRIDDVERVLALLLPESGLLPAGSGFTALAPGAVPVEQPAPTAELSAGLPVGPAEPLAELLAEPLAELPTAADAAIPSLIERGLVSKGGADGFTNAPRRAAWLRPFSWRRTGFALTENTVLLRHGVIARELALVPFARMQSVGATQGPIQRKLRLGAVHLHTVAGPVSARLNTIDDSIAAELFETLAAGAVASGASDTSHRWGSRQDAQ
ncbi:putative membrane protein [Microterricola gilva]|uniref:Putative membrane protein n=1 Tax=Microterricola gilva TaxID=393267 RepID=A0A4Q8AHX9_9MICO|nr:PH domain-containing protein [Microterricola gilva]RZU64012.1 putative membrane protein [Microterricola gilva]